MIKFGHIEYLFLLGLIPVLVLFIFLFNRWRKKTLLKFTTKNLEEELYLRKSNIREKSKYTLRILAVLFLILGLSNPKIGTNLKEVKRDGIEMVIALDLSNSMLCEDIKPNRLLRSKQAISELIDNLEGDRIGLVVFAGEAYTQLPITSDYSAAKMFLSTINTKTIETQGTNLSEAIRQSVKSFDFENKYNKSIIIITDGENHEQGALTEAKLAAEKGIFMHTLSVGDTNGGPIPLTKNKGYKKDRAGEVVITHRNPSVLEGIADKASGFYIDGNKTNATVDALIKVVSNAQKHEFETKQFSDYKDQFQWFVAIGLFFILLDAFLYEKKTKWLQKVDLFNEKKQS